MSAARELSSHVGCAAACRTLGVSRATVYRRAALPKSCEQARRYVPRALRVEERQHVLDLLHSERFVDRAPAEVYATLLDEGQYLCSERSMYRILAATGEIRERRDQLRHPSYEKPELLATGPNQVWSWDITKLRGPAKWCYFYLYVLLDIFSRYVVGWLVAESESAYLARRLIEETADREGISANQLTIHADRGAPMRSKSLAQLLADLAIEKSFSRPHTSNDNPFSESHFKTLKYHPTFPGRFGSVLDSRGHLAPFFHWYNYDHRHAGIAMMTPAQVHSGQAAAVSARRGDTLRAAYSLHPERFVNGRPRPRALPSAVWINPPSKPTDAADDESLTDASAITAKYGLANRPFFAKPSDAVDLDYEDSNSWPLKNEKGAPNARAATVVAVH